MQMNTLPHFDAVILADGEFPTADIPLQILREAKFLCCCDGAAAKAIEQGFMPDAIVGDGDSLTPEFKTRYAAIIHLEKEQDDNDLWTYSEYKLLEMFRKEIIQ